MAYKKLTKKTLETLAPIIDEYVQERMKNLMEEEIEDNYADRETTEMDFDGENMKAIEVRIELLNIIDNHIERNM